MLTVSDMDQIWFVLRMFSWTSSITFKALSYCAPLIEPDSVVYSEFAAVFAYGGESLSHRLQGNAVTDDTDSNVEVMNGKAVKEMLALLRDSTDGDVIQRCARDARQIHSRLESNQATSTHDAMLLALGVYSTRLDKTDPGKKVKMLKSFVTSVTKYAGKVARTASTTEPVSSEQVIYEFPYDILSAAEIEDLLRARVGVDKIKTKQVPGPHPNPTKKKDRVESLLYLDKNPHEARSVPNNSNDLQDSIIAGIVSKSFLRANEGTEKSAAKLGHQNEAPALKQYYYDSVKGIVPGVKLVSIAEVGLVMKKNKMFVRDSADGIGFEYNDNDNDFPETLDNTGDGDENDNEEYAFDRIKSHPIEIKCRSGNGSDGTIEQAYRIQKKIALLKGFGPSRADAGETVYYQVSSSSPHLPDLIPNESERIQCLHHAYTYAAKQTTFLVADPHGLVLYGLIITFDDELLKCYGRVLEHLYEHGLKIFYEGKVEDLPFQYIESVLLSDESLKKKFQLDDFMTSYLIWRALLPTLANPDPPVFPIPPCHMLVPLEYSEWNASKGGSDTVTRFTYNCQVVVPVKKPQAVIVARMFQLHAILLHRAIQSVTGTKELVLADDTLKSLRDRNNKRWPLHDTLSFLSERLVLDSVDVTSISVQDGPTNDNLEHSTTYHPPERFTKQNKKIRFSTDLNVLGCVGKTGATPIGKGKVRNPKNPNPLNHKKFEKRCRQCHGKPSRMVHRAERGKRLGELVEKFLDCAMCGQRTGWLCFGCKRPLCFDQDRQKVLRDKLKSDQGDNLRKKYPAFSQLGRNNAPEYFSLVGEIGNKELFTRKSCFHYAHPNYYVEVVESENEEYMDEDEESRDDQLMAVAAGGSSSPRT